MNLSQHSTPTQYKSNSKRDTLHSPPRIMTNKHKLPLQFRFTLLQHPTKLHLQSSIKHQQHSPTLPKEKNRLSHAKHHHQPELDDIAELLQSALIPRQDFGVVNHWLMSSSIKFAFNFNHFQDVNLVSLVISRLISSFRFFFIFSCLTNAPHTCELDHNQLFRRRSPFSK